jgi:hypothetical protein
MLDKTIEFLTVTGTLLKNVKNTKSYRYNTVHNVNVCIFLNEGTVYHATVSIIIR